MKNPNQNSWRSLKKFLFTLFFLSTLIFCSANEKKIVINSSESSKKIANKQEYFILNNINIIGNKVTKQHIILRELMFSKNDTINKSMLSLLVDKSKTNLLNTSLFNFVIITTQAIDSNNIIININVTERWYTWPVPLFEIQERNFNTWLESKNPSRNNYGFYLNRENFRGRKELLSFKVRLGYSEQYGFSYQIPYINNKQKAGLGISVYYSRSHEIPYATDQNKLLYLSNLSSYVKSGFSAVSRYTFRQGIYNSHTAELSYTKDNVTDTILHLNTDYFSNYSTTTEYITANYVFKTDHRNSKIYPLKGHYWGIQITKYGLGMLRNENLNTLFIETSINKYCDLDNRFYFATALKGRISLLPNQPYYAQRVLGYGDFVRGYEYYVVGGESFALLKTSLKYELIKPRIEKISWLPIEKFSTFHYALYTGIFTDVGYVTNNLNYSNNNLTNSILLGMGIGVDFVTYYDLVFRFEYSFNRLFEGNIFPHFGSAF